MQRLLNSILIALLGWLMSAGFVNAEWNAEMALENRWFTQDALDPQQHDGVASISGLTEFYHSWDGGNQSLTLKPFFRASHAHDDRSHVDLREFFWLMAGDDWEVRVGIDKVFWGVTEAYHLVDIINQADLLESPDGEEKLGQPMIKYSLEGDWSTFDAYLLPGFRERAFSNQAGRLRPHPVVASQAEYANERGKDYPGLAIRWSGSLGNWDFGLAHFHGISRAPRFKLAMDSLSLTPYYDVIDQSSLDVQVTAGDWLWKLETLYQKGFDAAFAAATGGFEYTFVGIGDTDMDLGVLLELAYDDRQEQASTPFNQDAFMGLRWVANDEAGSEILAGALYDWSNHSRFFSVEASRRLPDDWKIALQLKKWVGVAIDDPSYIYRNDDYIELKLIKFL